MSKTNIVFFGSDGIAIPFLDWIRNNAADRVHLAGVITQPDRAHGRGRKVTPGPIKCWAESARIPVMQPDPPDDATIARLKEQEIALALVMSYGHLLRRPVLESLPGGFWNLHGSILPHYRGASPIETALAEGDAETGVTLMEMVMKMDAGAIADIERVGISGADTTPSLREKLAAACVPLIARNLDALISGDVRLVPQKESEVTYCRKLTKQDGYLDFDLPARVLERRIRATQPWPGSFFEYDSTRIRVGAASLSEAHGSGSPGRITVGEHNDSLKIQTADGLLEIEQLQRPGGRMMPVADFLRGFPLNSGTVLSYPASEPWVREQPFGRPKRK